MKNIDNPVKEAKCNIENHDLSYFLSRLSRDKLLKIANNLGIKNSKEHSREELIDKITERIPKEYIPDVYSKSELTEFLMYLPKEIKDFIYAMFVGSSEGCDFGVWKQKELLKKYGKRVNQWIKNLSEYGLIFKLRKDKETFVIVPRDINFAIGNMMLDLVPPTDIYFEDFLQGMNKEELKEICRIYGIKLSGTKQEIIYNIMAYGLSPRDILSVMYYKDLVALSEELNIFPWGEKEPRKIDRKELIDSLSEHILLKSQGKKHHRKKGSSTDIYDLVIKIISNNFKPSLKWNSTEADIEKQLVAYLNGFFDGRNMNLEFLSQYRLSSGGKIDIYEPKNDIGVELKYNPSRAI